MRVVCEGLKGIVHPPSTLNPLFGRRHFLIHVLVLELKTVPTGGCAMFANECVVTYSCGVIQVSWRPGSPIKQSHHVFVAFIHWQTHNYRGLRLNFLSFSTKRKKSMLASRQWVCSGTHYFLSSSSLHLTKVQKNPTRLFSSSTILPLYFLLKKTAKPCDATTNCSEV